MVWWVPLAMAAGGAAMGAMKNQGDEQIEADDRRLAAETMRYSPWTGMRPGQIRQANLQNSVMQGAMSGGMMGMNMNQMQQGNELMNAQKNYYQSNAGMGGQGPVMQPQAGYWGSQQNPSMYGF